METLPRKWVKDIVTMTYKLEDARMDEDTALKAAGCKSFGGSIPSSSAENLFHNSSLTQWNRVLRYGRRG